MGNAWRASGSIILDCKHVVQIELPLPVVGDEQYCRSCAKFRVVTDSAPVYVVRCATGKCALSRNCRGDKDKAMAVARNHVQKMTRHKAIVYNGNLTVAEVTNTEQSLFVTGSELAATSAESQKMLRNMPGRGTTKPDGMG